MPERRSKTPNARSVRLALGADIVQSIGEKALGPRPQTPVERLAVTIEGGKHSSPVGEEAMARHLGPTVRLTAVPKQGKENDLNLRAFDESPTVRLAHVPGAQGDNVLLGQRGVAQLDAETRPALLVSYVYLKPFLENKHRYAYRDWVLDSGAFSAHNSGVEIKLDDYIEVCKKLLEEDPTLTEVFALDVIGDWKAGVKNCERMWKKGVQAIPCFHHGEPWDLLKSLCKDYPKVAIGGCVGKRDKDKFAQQCFARVWPHRLHGFGFGSEKSLMLVPWHSVDATNWEIAPCLAGDSLISTPEGLFPIAALVGKDLTVNTHDQTAISGCKAVQKGVKTIIKVSLRSGQSIRCTPDHKILTEHDWVEAGELVPGSKVRIVDRQMRQPILAESPMDEMLGWVLGDGWHTDGGGDRNVIGILFAPNDQEAMDKLMPVWDEFVGKDYSVQICNGVRRKSSESREVLGKLETFGFKMGRAPVKELPHYIYSARPEQQLAFLRGLFSADGCVSKVPNGSYNVIRLAAVSPKLLQQVQILLLEYGIQSRVYWSNQPTYKNPLGELHISGYSSRRFMQVIGFNLSAKTLRYSQKGKFHHKPAKYSEVIAVEPTGEEAVYDILMPRVHHFVANGIIVHNCKYGQWKAFGTQRVSVRGSKQNLRAEVEWYLDLERRARDRWKKEMLKLEAVGPSVRLDSEAGAAGGQRVDEALAPSVRLVANGDVVCERQIEAFAPTLRLAHKESGREDGKFQQEEIKPKKGKRK